MKCRIFVTTIALALIASLSAFAAKGEGRKGGGPSLLPPPIVQKLSAEQKTKYEALVKDAKGADEAKIKDLRKQAQALLTDEQKAEMKNLAAKGGKGKGKKK